MRLGYLLVAFTLSIASPALAELRLPETARATAASRDGEAQLQARLLLHPDDLASGARSLRVGVLLEPAPGWHLYWRNPGESGLAPQLDWQVEGARVGEIAWPAPSRFRESEGEIETFGYGEPVLLTSRAQLDAGASGPRTARVDGDVLICERECVPTRFSLARPLTPSGDPDSDAEERRLFEAAERALPGSAEELGVDLGIVRDDAGVALEVRSDAPLAAAEFFPDLLADAGPDFEVAEARPDPDRPGSWLVPLQGAEGVAQLRGVLMVADAGGARHPLAVDLPVGPAGSASAGLGFLGALGLALLGGLVLNLMPCVLPVLAIKVFAVAELAARGRRELRLSGLAYAGGVMGSMVLLAGVVVGLRRAGAAVGWGFQFQEPLFVAAISALLVVFALNLFGVFEIGAPQVGEVGVGGSPVRRSFFEGLLAVVLATPCTAPFLGTAVGFAFAAPPALVVAIFAAIGAGLAAPYLLVSWVPAWARFVPRSGSWMLSLRAGLGFALLATCVWLVWVFGRSAGADGVAALLAWLLGLAFAVWIYGKLQVRRPSWLPWAAAAAAILMGVPASVGLQPVPEAGPAVDWMPYAPPAVAAERADGRPAFVSFTADWCITCKVNERVVLDDPRVLDELARHDFALFRADWTRRDAAIRDELARFGRAGVPLYLVYPPGTAEPELLPELLSVDRVLEALRAAG